MNDKDRDRSSDGAGPVAHQNNNRPFPARVSIMRLCIFVVRLFLFIANPFVARGGNRGYEGLRGFSLSVDFGLLKASSATSNFYNGSPGNVNTLHRILYSETYGNSIWNNLTEQNLIGSSVASYNQITVAEYGNMYYRAAIQLGLGFRYDFYNSNWGWLAKFDYSKLHAIGATLLNSGHNTAYLTNQNAYVNCPTSGTEERIYVDLGILHKFKLKSSTDIELAVGANFNNTKVLASDIKIGGISYSILDVWGGQSPSSYVGTYPYVNQGGIGYGAFTSLAVNFSLAAGTAVSVGYTLHYNKVNLTGYEMFAFHHAVNLSFALNDFTFFD